MKIKMMAVAVVVVMLLASVPTMAPCINVGGSSNDGDDLPPGSPVTTTRSGNGTESCDYETPDYGYSDDTLLIKDDDFNKSKLGSVAYDTVERLYDGSDWYILKLDENQDVDDAMHILDSSGLFDMVEYDYIMKADSISAVDADHTSEQYWLDSMGVSDAWSFLGERGMAGGDPSVIVAVIDTGIDYNHVDLRDNVWINEGEIPGNGIDDDGNGFIDDYNGYDFSQGYKYDGNTIDYNGHGTHVAGVIAASNNGLGITGIAYNCKIMNLKVSISNYDYLFSSSVAQAIRYAQANGASVINMSFGSSTISTVVKEALMDAHEHCVLVASAGNNGVCNNTEHSIIHKTAVTYPAALPYVIGVMSCSKDGTPSDFSDYDDTPYNSIDYDVYAYGEKVISTWPDNGLAVLSGTSMATAMVSGVAALIRSANPDRNTYPTEFIQSCIVSSGQYVPGTGTHLMDTSAVSSRPTPSFEYIGYDIDDSTEYSDRNNGNGSLDAGERVWISLELFNIGTKGYDTTVDATSIDDDVTIINSVMSTTEIDMNSRVTSSVLIEVSKDHPDSDDVTIQIVIRCVDDINEPRNYSRFLSVAIPVSNVYILPSVIDEDITFDNSRRYVVSDNVTISEGIAVVFTEGCLIDYYELGKSYFISPKIVNNGILSFAGSENNEITIGMSKFFKVTSNGEEVTLESPIVNNNVLSLNYVSAKGLSIVGTKSSVTTIDHSVIDDDNIYSEEYGSIIVPFLHAYTISNSFIDSCKIVAESVVNSTLYHCASINNSEIESVENSVLEDVSATINSVKDSYLRITYARYLKIDVMDGSIVSSVSGYTRDLYIDYKCSNTIFVTEDSGYDRRSPVNLYFKGTIENVELCGGYDTYRETVIKNYRNPDGSTIFDDNDSTSFDSSKLIPYVENIQVVDNDYNDVDTIGAGEIRFIVHFNKDMDENYPMTLQYGIEGEITNSVGGSFTSMRTWEGATTISSSDKNGIQYFEIFGGLSMDGHDLIGTIWSFSFIVEKESNETESRILTATPSHTGIILEWSADNDLLTMGYNIYRCSDDGRYTRLNNSIISVSDNSFVDEEVTSGGIYWYYYTVIRTDMMVTFTSYSVKCTSMDLIPPLISHIPIDQIYSESNLTISCNVTDDAPSLTVRLYYRSTGNTDWDSISMIGWDNRYTATIYGSYLSSEGLQYYITANDGVSTTYSGSSDEPYNVMVKDRSDTSRLGDLDDDGTITVKDAQMMLQCIEGTRTLTDAQFSSADLNGNGTLDMVEVLRVLQYINGNVNTLNMRSRG